MMSYKPFLSKSKYLEGLKCHKLIWYRFNAKDEIPEYDADTQAVFNFGHLVGDKAKQMFPNGIEDASEQSFSDHLVSSRELLELRRPIFEGGYISENAYARADILEPVGDNAWDIIEVKAGRSVHDVNVHDVSFQRHCYENAGLKINRCFIMHVRPWVKVTHGCSADEIFEKVDITERVNEACVGIEDRIRQIREAILSKECPGICTGEQCNAPYGCVMKPVCGAA